jgi:hypothetical protein
MKFLFAVLIPFSLVIFSCNDKEEKKPELVARVFEKYLYRNDIESIVPDNISEKDSAELVKNYVNNWVRQTLLLHQAEQNLAAELKNFDKQLEDYRISLITYAYEKELVSQKLDTVVNVTEIEDYYKNNPGNFELKDNIIKVLYVKVSKKAPKIKKVQEWYQSSRPKDRESLQDYCTQFAENYYLNDETWLLFDDLLKEIPIETYDKEQFLQNNRLIELQDSGSFYFVNIKGFKIKDSVSPLSFEKENIKNIILNKRKLQLIDKMRKDIYDEAQKNKNFEIF